ncbi:MAG TPA: sigma-70 family RNA polymerase sigma factor [Kofleriaceae bacterium]|nr:sigma-70 family RNA polymerase sigma factor [Kofleriaceae bacterium]
MGATPMTDSDLVAASKRGELDAFGHLVARYQGLVCAVSFSSTGDPVLSEDVAQETFVEAWRHLDRVREPRRLRSWLCGIARNLGRKARKRRRREELTDVETHAADGANAFDQLAKIDAERIVRAALLRVPETYREVLVLYYRDDRPIREVAEALGLSEAAVMQRLSRGRRYLADGVTALVESSLRGTRTRRDLAAAVMVAITATALSSRVDASTRPKGSTMNKLAISASALAVVGATAYFATRSHRAATHSPSDVRSLHYGTGIARPPTLAAAAAPTAIVARTQATGDLPYLPADADAVLGIDVAKLRGSPLWQQFVAPALSSAAPIQQFAARCGFDPIAAVNSATLGLRGFGNDESFSGTAVLHGIDKTKALACFDVSGVPAAQQNGVQVAVEGNVALLTTPDGFHAGFTFVDDTTALVVLGPDAATAAGIAKIAAGGGGLDAAAGFSSLFANVAADDSLWLVVTDASPLLAQINASTAQYTGIKVHGVFGSLDVADTLSLHGGIRLDSPDLANKIVADAQQQLDAITAAGASTQYFDQLDIVSDSDDVLLDVTMNVAELLAFARTGTVNVEVN